MKSDRNIQKRTQRNYFSNSANTKKKKNTFADFSQSRYNLIFD